MILLFMSGILSTLNAQYLKEFSQDTANYITELTTLFGNSLNPEQAVAFQQFKVFVEVGQYINVGDTFFRAHHIKSPESLPDMVRFRTATARADRDEPRQACPLPRR